MIRWGPELTEDSDALKKAKARLAAKVESPRPWEAPPTAPLVACLLYTSPSPRDS